MSALPDPAQHRPSGWGMWGYSGYCCDLAIRRDDPVLLGECIDRGFADVDTRMLAGTMLEWCDKHAPRCAAVLKERAEESRRIEPAKAGMP